MKSKVIVGIIVILGISASSFGAYGMYKYSISEKSLETGVRLMHSGNLKEAKEWIYKAGEECPKNLNVEVYKKQLKEEMDAKSIYEDGIALKNKEQLKQAVEVFKTINPQEKEFKKQATEQIEEISKLEKTKAKQEKEKIEKEAQEKKLKEEQLESQNNNETQIESTNNSASGEFSNNKYKGLGNQIQEESGQGSFVRYISEYNPNLISNSSFIAFYNEKIKPLLRQGVIYDLVNIDNPSEALIFAGAPNENDEFNKGIMNENSNYPKGGLSLNDPNGQYCGIHGDNIIAFNLSNQKRAQFTFS